MGDYVARKLAKRNLIEIVETCRKALLKGYLDDAEWEKEGIMRTVRMRDFERFKSERKEANERYDKFCEYLEEVLPEIEEIKDPIEKLKKLGPLYEQTLEYDGRRRWYDRGLNDQFGETILVYHINLIKNLLSEIGKEDLLFDIVNGYDFDSFRVEMMKDYLKVLYTFPPSIKNKSRLSVEDLTSLSDEVSKEIEILATKYTHSSIENTINKLNLYLIFSGREKEILEELENKKKDRIKRRKKTIAKIRSDLQKINKLEEFEKLLKIVDELTFYNIYEDEFRHTQLKELADYFLREEVAKTLYLLGIIDSPNPMNYPQRYLLKKVKEILNGGTNG